MEVSGGEGGRKEEGAYDGEDGVALTTVLNGIVDDTVLFGGLLTTGVLHVSETLLHVAHVDLGETAVEEDFCGVELELETELLIVDELVAAEVEEGGGEVVVGGVVAGEEEVGDTALEVSALTVSKWEARVAKRGIGREEEGKKTHATARY